MIEQREKLDDKAYKFDLPPIVVKSSGSFVPPPEDKTKQTEQNKE